MRVLRCPRCQKGGYTQGVAYDGRPKFTCTACDHWWTAGLDGGEWARSLKQAEPAAAEVRMQSPSRPPT